MASALVGIKVYVTNLNIPDEEVITYYHQLFQIEAPFRMANSDLRTTPIYHRKRDSIEAHLTIALAALATRKRIEHQTGISIKQFVKLLRPIRSGIVTINGKESLAEPDCPETVKKIANLSFFKTLVGETQERIFTIISSNQRQDMGLPPFQVQPHLLLR
jgi:hypothetical protein